MSEEVDNSNYDSGHIRVLKGLEAVRARPGMYIGDTDDEHGSGLHHMIYEVVHNSVDEALAGHCSKMVVELCADDSVKVSDDGRGVPIDIHKEEGVHAAELIMTVLHAGGKFNQNAYKVSGGLHGVGVSVVNALSDWLTLDVTRDGKHYHQLFKRGEPEAPDITDINHATTGTTVQFLSSLDTFVHVNYNRKVVAKTLKELAYLNRGIKIQFIDSRDANDHYDETYYYEGGISEFVATLNETKTVLHDNVIAISGEQDHVSFELSMQWTSSYQEHILCYTNNIHQADGGTHLAALKTSLTRTVNKYANELLKSKLMVQGDDVREGLTAVISVKMADPKFSSQTKSKLVSSEVKKVIELSICQHLMSYLEEHPKIAEMIIKKVEEASRAREAARRARDISRKTDQLSFDVKLSAKLAECQLKDPEKIEVFIVEGESAGGSAKQGRDRRFQAILPLKGKILNVEKARYDKVLSSDQIATLIMALGCGIGKDGYDPDKLRYHRVIIMTDADVDGAHIRTLLLTFFYRQMPELLERGHIYIAKPPLYQIRKGKTSCYLKDEEALYDFLLNDVVNQCLVKKDDTILIAGNEIKDVVINYYEAEKQVHSKYHYHPIDLFLSMMLVKPLSLEDLEHPDSLEAYAKALTVMVQNRPDFQSKRLSVSAILQGIEVVYEHSNGTDEKFMMDKYFISSALYKRISVIANICHVISSSEVTVEMQGHVGHVQGVKALVDHIMTSARKGYTVQRYKGLGEMDAEQLWETTLDPDVRTLIRLNTTNGQEADQLFSMLMGDIVEPRKKFIEENALSAENVDT
ncbi:DNA topoisomerase (ATP-hydrolyzing) subunit B [Gammaproteobacteria bacterium]|nr:DNA topoisomerase (ATP-hydrolyzing) subunit B [Gammaproteobacteria bacterium]